MGALQFSRRADKKLCDPSLELLFSYGTVFFLSQYFSISDQGVIRISRLINQWLAKDYLNS